MCITVRRLSTVIVRLGLPSFKSLAAGWKVFAEEIGLFQIWYTLSKKQTCVVNSVIINPTTHTLCCTVLCVFFASVRRDINYFGVNVCIIEPGFFKTAVTSLDPIERELRRLWNQLDPEVQASYGDKYLDKCKRDLLMDNRWRQHDRSYQIISTFQALSSAKSHGTSVCLSSRLVIERDKYTVH